MSPPPPPASPSTEELEADLSAATISKKQLNKEARKAAKAAKAEKAGKKTEKFEAVEADPFAANYGYHEIQSKGIPGRSWTDIGDLDEAAAGRSVLVRGFAERFRPVSNKMTFIVLRKKMSTVQCVLVANADAGVSTQMVRFATSLSRESVIDVEGVVSVPKEPLKSTTQQVEIQVRKVYCISGAIAALPFNLEDAVRSEAEFEKAEQDGEKLVRVLQDTGLNYRVVELRTATNQATFRIQSEVEMIFREYLYSKSFIGVHSPKLISGSSEGGAAVFELQYHGQPACLAQSPQLYKQMCISGGFVRVFEVGSIFRAENSNTHRHLCEFTGLDAEMEINEHYFEVCDIIDGLFVAIFKHLNENCKNLLEIINKQYPFEPLKYLEKTLKITYEEGIQMLKDAGTEIEPMSDLNTEAEKKLGRLVKEKYGTEFFILYRYPLAVRPFYTMPCYEDPAYSNSFDVFIRGEEIISGAQRIHTHELLRKRAIECGIDTSTISSYIESFSYGVPPHGGFGVGLERVVMLFCALNNIRKTSLFPRDPQRLTP
ncbi:aspartate--tRNA ligase 2, cytoplasmic-like [Lolium rigidum]|uniref:aspartate--tRNA ligase 2, cytoplasmic-like n=1 Tax=Lolium rigidum TaxID=89674 RepID=UPI001F5CA9D1|nr:aspartate--tRNA ligase 2, cytoplasmic-like [Lolium rigidum]